MQSWATVIWSSVGRKILSAITGVILYLFIMVHLLGNLQLFESSPDPFNLYANFLEKFEGIITIIEIGLLISILFHIVVGTTVYINKLKARPEGYIKTGSAGPPSRKTISSTTMIYTGIVIAVFIIIHIITFKYGPGIDEGYVSNINGTQVRDLYRLVVETFSKPGYVIWYVAAMIFLGFHLRHAFWSAFQSMGWTNPKFLPILYVAGVILAILMAMGFIIIPIWIYFTGGAV